MCNLNFDFWIYVLFGYLVRVASAVLHLSVSGSCDARGLPSLSPPICFYSGGIGLVCLLHRRHAYRPCTRPWSRCLDAGKFSTRLTMGRLVIATFLYSCGWLGGDAPSSPLLVKPAWRWAGPRLGWEHKRPSILSNHSFWHHTLCTLHTLVHIMAFHCKVITGVCIFSIYYSGLVHILIYPRGSIFLVKPGSSLSLLFVSLACLWWRLSFTFHARLYYSTTIHLINISYYSIGAYTPPLDTLLFVRFLLCCCSTPWVPVPQLPSQTPAALLLRFRHLSSVHM